jgi:threonylcarbamoyladenosine tRNA methylthiotransferase MtaB
LAEKGFLEVVLIGIHLASYGKDLEGISLIDVLEDINKIEGIKRIRLGSLEPTFINEESIKRLKNISKLCKHFHLSLQSGCDETLKRMNRRYTTAEYKQRVELLRENFENVAITTDIIAGFPGETEQEFDTTYNFLKDIKLSKMHIFPYSKRKGTVAESMKNQVPEDIKDIRTKKLISLSDENEKEFKRKFIGKEMEVILERKERNGYRQGYNEQYVDVFIKKGNAGDFIKLIGDKENLQIID